jgi:hypothetical protein
VSDQSIIPPDQSMVPGALDGMPAGQMDSWIREGVMG